jgi:hypothetical protein
MNGNRFDVVKPENLWNAFNNVVFENEPSDQATGSILLDKSMHKIMNTWTERAGYPVVIVTRRDESLVLTQVRHVTCVTRTAVAVQYFYSYFSFPRTRNVYILSLLPFRNPSPSTARTRTIPPSGSFF